MTRLTGVAACILHLLPGQDSSCRWELRSDDLEAVERAAEDHSGTSKRKAALKPGHPVVTTVRRV